MVAGSRRRGALLVVAGVVVLLSLVLVWHRGERGARSEVVDGASSRPGWKTVEYDDVRVDVPARWERADSDGCEFGFEHWAPARSPRCDVAEGVAFYASATYDPARGPGVVRTTAGGRRAWAGYTLVADLAVYVASGDREVARAVLASARGT